MLAFTLIYIGTGKANELLEELVSSTTSECMVFMGPSLIKEAEQQGYGMGLFTGKMLFEGQDIHWDEVLLPLYDSATIDENHPPLREYLWPGDMLPEMAYVASANRNELWFSPGLSSVAPCTSRNFNLGLSGPGSFAGANHASSRSNLLEDDNTPPRTSPRAGSYSYHHALSYEAIRTIMPGEELVLECNYNEEHKVDTPPAPLTIELKFNSSDSSYVCMDNVRSGPSTAVGGQGLFAQQLISKNDRIIASPIVPIHRKEMFGDGTGNTAPAGFNSYQLMLNYAMGHPKSDLLLLPYGPLVNYINHPPPGKQANAIIKWHSNGRVISSRRQQYHHPELFELSAKEVSETHGKGLMIDIVALYDIGIDEEIYIDYGDAWAKAWENHGKRWKTPSSAYEYISADKWFNSQESDNKNENYPDNLQTLCYYDGDAKVLRVDEESKTIYAQWQDDELPHECLRPCKILETYPDPVFDQLLFTAEMFHFEGESRFPFCELKEGRHIARDIIDNGILIVDKPYSTDMFLEQAFRHEIGVPDGFFPDKWFRQKVRRRSTASSNDDSGNEFKRKKVGEVVSKKMQLKGEQLKAASARGDL